MALAEDGRAGRSRSRGVALALAMAAHALLFTALVWRFESPSRTYAPTVMDVELAVPRPLDRARPPPPRSGKPAHPAATPEAPPILHQPAQETSPDPVALPQPAPGPAVEAEGARQALRGLVGCGHAGFLGLTEAERQRCQDLLARVRGGDARSAQIELDLARRAAAAKGPEKEGFLARTPHNGCVPRVKEKEVGVPGETRQDWTTGIACAWSF